jgi:hypothetical protein
MKPLAALSLACAFAQSVEAPRVGAMLDRRGSLRPVHGVAASFVIGPETAGGVLSAACSADWCLAKTAGELAEAPAPPGPAVIGIDGRAAWVYFPATGEFAHWEDGVLTPLDWRVDGEVLSISPDARIAVRRASGVWVVSPDGATLDSLPEASGPVLLLADETVFAAGDELVLQRPDRSQARFALSGVARIATLGEGWAQVSAESGTYALDLRREALYVLPETAE